MHTCTHKAPKLKEEYEQLASAGKTRTQGSSENFGTKMHGLSPSEQHWLISYLVSVFVSAL